ncbi:MAG: helix-hairpin-helix domain-containing protein [Flavobacteriales bacterium]|nr:helix-hairpin-helix domain-containing protein [Flavobacteriales bacterium]MCB9362963.1 helix-hairpin-helix domain-containing protein [Flavobacteriales bacterium]
MSRINNYFSFSRGEKRGVVILFSIIILLIIGIQFADYFNVNKITDFSEFENAINQFEKEQNSKLKSEKTPVKVALFNFNPNTISDSEWVKLGFKEWQIKTINNYKTKGGYWKSKNDVAKIYGLDSNHFEQLKPYILLPDEMEDKPTDFFKKESEPIYFDFNPNTITKAEWKKLGFADWQIKAIFKYKTKGGKWNTKADVSKIYGLEESKYIKLKPYILLPDKTEQPNSTKKEKNYTQKVNVNTATAKDLLYLKGINSEKYASIIIKYRNSLGGFIKKEQLKEVWNLSEETYLGFEHQIDLGIVKPVLLNINTDEIKDLTKHPYIDWKTGNAIIKYRKANGNYNTIEDIKKIHLISSETYLKIAPYLTVR